MGGSSNQWHQLWTKQSAILFRKYPVLEELLSYRFTAARHRTVSNRERDNHSISLDDAYRLVFVDGYFSSVLSNSDIGPWKIEIGEDIRNNRSFTDPIQEEAFLDLTESLSQERISIYLPSGNIADKPLYLLHLSKGSEDQKALSIVHQSHYIEIARGASSQLIEHFVSLESQAHFRSARTSIIIGDNAYLNYINLSFESQKSYHFFHNDIRVGRDATVCSSTFLFGGRFSRHQTSVQLNGVGSRLSMNSLSLPYDESIINTFTYLEHNHGHCISRQLHKAIAQYHSKYVFNGLIKVSEKALKTDSKMTNNNLLLDNCSSVSTEPKLEIYADDVKCSHGATIGGIDEEQIFYLRSRGIPFQEARRMIIDAFSAEVAENIDNHIVRETVLVRIANALKQEGALA